MVWFYQDVWYYNVFAEFWHRLHRLKTPGLMPCSMVTVNLLQRDLEKEKCNASTLFGCPVQDTQPYKFRGKFDLHGTSMGPNPEASESTWAAILAQMPQNFSHMYLHMSSNRYVSRFYKQSSDWVKLLTIVTQRQLMRLFAVKINLELWAKMQSKVKISQKLKYT